MAISMKFGMLLGVVWLCCLTPAAAEERNQSAPESTTSDAAISFWDMPYLDKAFIDTSPADRGDNIPSGKLSKGSGNQDMISKLAGELADKKHGLYDSMLISHNAKLVFESYYLRGRIDLPHFQASATKVYTGLALGRAIQLGYLTMADLNKPIISFLEDIDSTKLVDGAEKVTLHKAMTMRSGIRISDDKRKELEENPKILKGQGLVQAWLERSAPITNESQRYLYSFDPELVMQVIEASVPGTAKAFIKKEILDKMGISNYQWKDGISGLPDASEGASMTSRAMVKLGTLVIDNGKWDGKQLISADYLAKATSEITQPTEDWQPDTYSYGYYWYQTNLAVGDKSYNVNLAWGGGGQRIIVIKELELIIVITGHDGEDTIMTQVTKVLLPAFAE